MPSLNFSHRYNVGHGTMIHYTFKTAADLNTWFDSQDSHGQYFCRLYDDKEGISIKGSDYMWLPKNERWKDTPQQKGGTATPAAQCGGAVSR